MVEWSSRQNDAPEDVHILIPGTSEDGPSYGKMDFGLSVWGLSSQCPYMREAGGSESVKQEVGMMQARGPKPRNTAASRSRKRHRSRFSLNLRRAQPSDGLTPAP